MLLVMVMLFISLLILEISFFTNIGHHSFLAAAVMLPTIQKGRKHHARGPFLHEESRPVQDGLFDMVLLWTRFIAFLQLSKMLLAFPET